MARIGSFVFLDLETTGLPYQEKNQTKITELAMIAVNRDHILSSELGYLPRVLQKLVLCFFTARVISDIVTRITGLSNHILQNERKFDKDTVDTINGFLDRQQKPVCFVVHNGNLFDYPILRAEIDDLKMKLGDDVVCIDSLSMFRQFNKKKSTPKEKFGRLYINRLDWEALDNLEKTFVNNTKPAEESQINSADNDTEQDITTDELDAWDEELSFDLSQEQIFQNDDTVQMSNSLSENVHSQSNINVVNGINQQLDSLRSCFIPQKKSTIEPLYEQEKACVSNMKNVPVKNVKQSFKLGELYERLLGKAPTGAHHAEGDCLMLLECCMVEPKKFVEYCDSNSKPFASMPRMQPRVFTTAKAPIAAKKKPPTKPTRAHKLNQAF